MNKVEIFRRDFPPVHVHVVGPGHVVREDAILIRY